jgi:hypothetical protein
MTSEKVEILGGEIHITRDRRPGPRMPSFHDLAEQNRASVGRLVHVLRSLDRWIKKDGPHWKLPDGVSPLEVSSINAADRGLAEQVLSVAKTWLEAAKSLPNFTVPRAPAQRPTQQSLPATSSIPPGLLQALHKHRGVNCESLVASLTTLVESLLTQATIDLTQMTALEPKVTTSLQSAQTAMAQGPATADSELGAANLALAILGAMSGMDQNADLLATQATSILNECKKLGCDPGALQNLANKIAQIAAQCDAINNGEWLNAVLAYGYQQDAINKVQPLAPPVAPMPPCVTAVVQWYGFDLILTEDCVRNHFLPWLQGFNSPAGQATESAVGAAANLIPVIGPVAALWIALLAICGGLLGPAISRTDQGNGVTIHISAIGYGATDTIGAVATLTAEASGATGGFALDWLATAVWITAN